MLSGTSKAPESFFLVGLKISAPLDSVIANLLVYSFAIFSWFSVDAHFCFRKSGPPLESSRWQIFSQFGLLPFGFTAFII